MIRLLVAQKRATPPENAEFAHLRRSEMLNVVEMSPMACDATNGAEPLPVFVDIKLSPVESRPALIEYTAASVQLLTMFPSAPRKA